MKWLSLIFVLALLLVSCKVVDESAATPSPEDTAEDDLKKKVNPPATAEPNHEQETDPDDPDDPVVISEPSATTGLEDVLYSFTPKAELVGATFSIDSTPSWAQFNTTTGKLSGYPEIGTYKINITETKDAESAKTSFTITVTGDPLTQYAWHLRNSGQSSFASKAGTTGEDMNVTEAIRSGTKGLGVRVAVSDTGLEIAHEDIAANVLMGESRNYNSNPASPYLGDPTSTTATKGDHGTSVTGIVAAAGWNSKGARGIAPLAKVAAFNFISSSQDGDFLYNQVSGNFDIFNQSWGYALDTLFPYSNAAYKAGEDAYTAKIQDGVTTLRSGKGAIYVRSAGNSAEEALVGGTSTYIGIPANNDPNNVRPQVIVVGAMNAKGEKSSYSSTGSCLWVAGLGGEYGSTDPAMITADQSGCTNGYSRSTSTVSSFMSGSSALNSSCNYSHTFNGTSSAAPSVAGAVALMLEANPNLSWRDVKHILAATATKVQPSIAAVTRSFDPPGYVSELAWVTNAAGYHFHNYFGFGRVDAEAAVTMARTHTPMTSTLTSATVNSGALSLAIPDDSATGVTSNLATASNLIVEAVQIEVDITHPFVMDLGVELTSPSGTKSILFNAINIIDDDNFASTKMLSNAFYGESATGTWTLKAVDAIADEVGTLTRWSITIHGHAP